MATCLVVEHAPAEMAYVIGAALQEDGVDLERCRVYGGDEVPVDASRLDGLVVMGGPMSAGSDADFPSRRQELDLLRDAIERGIPTLGVCLGAQLLAAAFGAAVYPGDVGAEVGWAPVFLDTTTHDDGLFGGLPLAWTVLHWHGDTFDLPVGAVHLASSERYPNQAFRIGDNAWGVQFHLEVDQSAVEAFAAAFPDEAPAGVTGATADAALDALQPIRSIVCHRFAQQVLASEMDKEAVTLSSGNSIA